jgi:toxin ParE1/3/4
MKARYTRRARSDIAEIFAYVSKDSPDAALRVRRAIFSSIELIAARPYLGIKNARALNLRSRLVSRYPYRVHYFAENEEILILRVWHTARRSMEAAP